MMNRNIEKIIATTEIPQRYELGSKDIQTIMTAAEEKTHIYGSVNALTLCFHCITAAYSVGFQAGSSFEKNKRRLGSSAAK